MGQLVTRRDKTGELRQFYKGDDGKLYSSYNAAVSAQEARNRQILNQAGSGLSLGNWGSPFGDVGKVFTKLGGFFTKPGNEFYGIDRTPSSDPLARRRFYMSQVPGPERSMDMDAPVSGLTMDSPVYDSPVAPVKPITYGLDSSGAVDRRQSDDYRSAMAQYAPQPMTAEGQFKRYFGTPEFDYVFGSGARGQGAPKTAEEMMYLGTNTQARDAKTNLATLYASQSAAGRVNQDLIQRRYDEDPTLTAEQKTNLKKWAEANPMIAQREYTKWLEKGGFNRPEGEELAEAYGSSSNASGGDTSRYPGVGFDASKMLTLQVNPQEGSRYPGTGFDAAQLLTAGLGQQSATAAQADQATTTGVGRRRNLAAETEQFLKNLRTVEY